MRGYNKYKNLTPENLYKRYETFLYNFPSNKCKTKQQSFIRMKHICKNIRTTGYEVNSKTYNSKQGGLAFDTVGKTLHRRRCRCISGTDGKEFSGNV